MTYGGSESLPNPDNILNPSGSSRIHMSCKQGLIPDCLSGKKCFKDVPGSSYTTLKALRRQGPIYLMHDGCVSACVCVCEQQAACAVN